MVKEIENLEAKMNWHWRDTMRSIRFFSFDGRCAFMIPVWLLYLRTSTIILTVIVFYTFRLLENKGLTFPSALRALRLIIIGNTRPSKLGLHRHVFKEYDA